MASAEGILKLNPALLLFWPKEAKRPNRRVLTLEQIGALLQALDFRERLVAKLCVLAGMRPGEVFALRWGSIGPTFLELRERVYEGVLDSPKSERQASWVAGAGRDRRHRGMEKDRDEHERNGVRFSFRAQHTAEQP